MARETEFELYFHFWFSAKLKLKFWEIRFKKSIVIVLSRYVLKQELNLLVKKPSLNWVPLVTQQRV